MTAFTPSELERRAAELYTCGCGAALDYPGAWCPSCDSGPLDLTPEDDGPDAADLWEAAQLERQRRAELGGPPVRHPLIELLGGALAALLGSGLVALGLVCLLVPDPVLVTWLDGAKAAALAHGLEIVAPALVVLLVAFAARVAWLSRGGGQ